MKTSSVSIAQIRMARGFLNISQADVAKAINLSPSSYSAIEAEKSDPKISTYNKIIAYFEKRGVIFRVDGTISGS